MKRDEVAWNREQLGAVYEELEATGSHGLRYETFQLADGVSFVSLVETDGLGRFSQLETFRSYRAALDERCDEPPTVTELELVGDVAVDEVLKVAIVVGSTRPARKAEAVARWVHELARRRPDASFEIVDVADFDLPLLDEPLPPEMGEYSRTHTRDWAAAIASFDAYVFVTPEYNHSIPAALKNAIDFLFAEWNHKAAGFVGYGATGGARAVEHLRQVLGELEVAAVRTAVELTLAGDWRDFTDPRSFDPLPGQEDSVVEMLDQLVAWGGALRALRDRSVRRLEPAA